MSATEEAVQSQLIEPEIDPNDDPRTARWLHLAEAGIDSFTIAQFALEVLSGIPNLEVGDAELFKKAANRVARVCAQEVGRRAWEASSDKAVDRLNKAALKAKDIRAKEMAVKS